jgi:hypothetical protein
MAKRGRPENYYTVYLNATNAVVATGTTRECAKQLGIKYESFQYMLYKCRNGEQKKYTVIDEAPKEIE